MSKRTPEEVRQSIEANRAELAVSVEKLRGEVVKATDWRAQLRAHKREVIIGAAVAGFVVGGGIAAMTGLLTGRQELLRRHLTHGLRPGGGGRGSTTRAPVSSATCWSWR